MTEKHILFGSKGKKLEGLLEKLPGDNCVIVTHPHPLYGGDMNNHVVDTICRAYHKNGFSTLRFNFRGVGQSEGKHDNGIGEQDDISSAVDNMIDLGKKHIHLAGYSFGAWVIYLGLEKYTSVKKVVLVSPPVGFLDFSPNNKSSKIELIIAGSNDDIADPEKIQDTIPRWNPKAALSIIQHADHFYLGKHFEIKSIIDGYLNRIGEEG